MSMDRTYYEENKDYYMNSVKPVGDDGAELLGRMNNSHAPLVDWGMQILDGLSAAELLDIGCGGGRNTDAMMKRFPDSHMTAVDYSEVSVRLTSEYCAEALESGKITVRQADVSALPFEDETFDLASGFETVYFWPGIEKCFAEVARVLKKGGHLFLVNEADGSDEEGEMFASIIDGMTTYSIEELEKAALAVGFSEARGIHHEEEPWISFLATR